MTGPSFDNQNHPGLEPDPITGQLLSQDCWNGLHHGAGGINCDLVGCACLCHLEGPGMQADAADDGNREGR